MKKMISLIMVMVILLSFGSTGFAGIVKEQNHLENHFQRTDLTILVDTPTELIYTYKYQGVLYKNIELIQKDIIETEVYKFNENTQKYEITDSFTTDIDSTNILENKIIPHNYDDPTIYMYRYGWTEEGRTHIANMSLAGIRAAILLLVPGGWAHNIGQIANAFYSAGVDNMYYRTDVYRQITNNNPVWYKEVRDWYLDYNFNNYVDTTTDYYQWWN